MLGGLKMNLLVSGCCGRIGRQICSVQKENVKILAGIDRKPTKNCTFPVYARFEDVAEEADCIVDFSHPSNTRELLKYALKHKTPVLIGTTGQNCGQMRLIGRCSAEIPIFLSVNLASCFPFLIDSAMTFIKTMKEPDVAISEVHRQAKADAPSGTAKEIRSVLSDAFPGKQIGVTSQRLGEIRGIHEIRIVNSQESVVIRHEILSDDVFVEGALNAVWFLSSKGPGLYTRLGEE